METKSYACINNDDETRSLSSSGGIYPLIAKRVITEGGVVFAACYNEQLEVVHKRIENIDELPKSQGSKYVESNLGNTFRDIIKLLKRNKKVLFVGTPCQCAGLNSLLQEEKQNRDLILLVDFVCHGIPSRVAWRAYKDPQNHNGEEIEWINMRSKSTGWSYGNYAWTIWYKDTRTEEVPQRQVTYMKGMMANLFLRPTCHDCRFKGIERCTDITLGDCWGIWKNEPEMDDDKGTSLVLTHTRAGNYLIESIMNNMRVRQIDLQNAIVSNSCIIESTKRNHKTQEFYLGINKGEKFDSIITSLTRLTLSDKVKNKIRRVTSKWRQANAHVRGG